MKKQKCKKFKLLIKFLWLQLATGFKLECLCLNYPHCLSNTYNQALQKLLQNTVTHGISSDSHNTPVTEDYYFLNLQVEETVRGITAMCPSFLKWWMSVRIWVHVYPLFWVLYHVTSQYSAQYGQRAECELPARVPHSWATRIQLAQRGSRASLKYYLSSIKRLLVRWHPTFSYRFVFYKAPNSYFVILNVATEITTIEQKQNCKVTVFFRLTKPSLHQFLGTRINSRILASPISQVTLCIFLASLNLREATLILLV